MTASFYPRIPLAGPRASLLGRTDPVAVVEFGDAGGYLSFPAADDVLPLLKALAQAVRLLETDADKADDLLFDAIATPEVLASVEKFSKKAMARMFKNIRQSIAEGEHVRYCDSCDASSADAYLLAVTIADTGERKFYCADNEACGKRRAALHVAPPQADGETAKAGA